MPTARDPAGVADVVLPRSYRQWCPIAVGLDILGDRWTLLIVRDLMIADRRFTELRRALPGLAPNLLTERLRTLVDIGLVTTAELPPPSTRAVYRLTEHGWATAPVLRALARFGARHLVGEPGPEVDAIRAANALMIPWYRPAGRPMRVRLTVTSATNPEASSVDLLLERPIRVELVAPNGADRPADVSVVTTIEDLAAARRADAPLESALTGPSTDVEAVRAAFAI